MNSGRNADSRPLTADVAAGFASIPWPIAARYELRDGAINRGNETRGYRRIGLTDEASSIEPLTDADDAAVLDWVRTRGFLGVSDDPAAEVESLAAIREYAGHINRVRELLRALGDFTTPSGTLVDLASRAAGHLVDPRHLTDFAGDRGFATLDADSDIRLQAFHALASTVRDQVARRTGVVASVVASRDGYLELRPQFLARGPLAAAYLEILADASRLQVPWDVEAITPSARRLPPAICRWCSRTFVARRHDARFCSDRCRWAATKAASRQRKRQPEGDK